MTNYDGHAFAIIYRLIEGRGPGITLILGCVCPTGKWTKSACANTNIWSATWYIANAMPNVGNVTADTNDEADNPAETASVVAECRANEPAETASVVAGIQLGLVRLGNECPVLPKYTHVIVVTWPERHLGNTMCHWMAC